MTSLKKSRARERFRKKVRQGHRGWPTATIAFYGPTDKKATKVVVSLIVEEGGEIAQMERWQSEQGSDLRRDTESNNRIIDLVDRWKPKSIVSMDQIIGCPHEEGIDYPEGESCPDCPFWKDRDRWTGERLQ